MLTLRKPRSVAALMALVWFAVGLTWSLSARPAEAATVNYYLPYSSGTTWYVSQGNGGTTSHQCPGTNSCRAYDFIGASNTSNAGQDIRASAPGKIRREPIRSFTGQDSGGGFGNHVVVEHDDGTCTVYAHMKPGSVTGKSSQQPILQGEKLGEVGNTGWTEPLGSGFHLHFARVDCVSFVSIATGFVESGGQILAQGQNYTSQNPGAGGPVDPAPVNVATTTAVTSSANPSVVGQAVTLTASVSASAGTPTGSVSFTVDGAAAGSGTLSGGKASISTGSLGVGPHTVVASYGGATGFDPSASGSFTQTVNKAATSTSVSSSVNPSVYGQPTTFTATVTPTAPGAGSPSGTVQFSIDGTNRGAPVSLTGGTASLASVFDLEVGSHTVTAAYSGDGSFLASASAPASQVVNKAPTTATVSASPNPVKFGDAVDVTVGVAPSGAFGTAVAKPTGTVDLVVDGQVPTQIPLTSGAGAVRIGGGGLAPGDRAVSVSYPGDARYLPSSSKAVKVEVTCDRHLTGNALLLLPVTDVTCVKGGNLVGPVVVAAGGRLAIEDSTVVGPIASIGAGAVRICDSHLSGPVAILRSTGFVQVGGDAVDGCAANAVLGPVVLLQNQRGAKVVGNKLTVFAALNNRGAGPWSGQTAPIISGNLALVNLVFPLPSSSGSPLLQDWWEARRAANAVAHQTQRAVTGSR